LVAKQWVWQISCVGKSVLL